MEKKIYVRNVLEYADVKESLKCERDYGRELGREEGREEGLEQGREEGLEQGREEGLEQGREEGLEQGREEGIQQGEDKTKRLIACNMIAKGLDPTLVAEITGLTLTEIQALAQE